MDLGEVAEVLTFLSRSASWTCSACRKYGTGFASWKDHREASPDCAVEQDREDHVGHVHTSGEQVVPSIHAHVPFRVCPVAACWWGRRGTPRSVTDPQPTHDVSAAAARIHAEHDPAGAPEVHWWVALDVNGVELCGRRPYEAGSTWTVKREAYGLHSLGWSPLETGPLLVTAPIGAAVREGDRITVGAASGGRVALEVEQGAGGVPESLRVKRPRRGSDDG